MREGKRQRPILKPAITVYVHLDGSRWIDAEDHWVFLWLDAIEGDFHV